MLSILACAFLSGFSGLPLSRPIAVSASLSDPRCFRSLSVASVLDSDYSASVLPFCSLHASASQLLLRCSFGPFVPQVFPLPSRLVSHPFSPVLLTWPCCSFPFALPCFTPTAAPQVLASFPFTFAPVPLAFFCSAPLPFVRFRLPVSATQLSRSSFPLLPSLALRRLVRCSVVSFVPTISSSFRPGFP